MMTYLLAWFPMLLLAIINGVLREAFFRKYMPNSTAHQLSTLTLLLLLAAYIFFIIQRFPPASAVQALFVGAGWMGLTLFFEFGLGLYRGLTWQVMLADYNVLEGRLWLLIPLWILVAPPFILYFIEKN